MTNPPPKITYLLGAGASINIVPTVNQLEERIDSYLTTIRSKLTDSNDELFLVKDLQQNKSFYEEHIDELEKIIKVIPDFQTIDTYAKYLHMTEQEEKYLTLKKHFSIYLILEQVLFKDDNSHPFFYNFIEADQKLLRVDNRYLKFLTTILKQGHMSWDFPGNVKILSWNYDYQFELASKYFKLENNHKRNAIYPTNISLEANRGGGHSENLIYFHLNWCAGWESTQQDNTYPIEFVLNEAKNNNLKYCNLFSFIKNYYSSSSASDEFIRFAWEDNRLFDDSVGYGKMPIKENIVEHIKKSEYLIVIGYSFPDFNREYDAKIINLFKENKFKGIYIQNIEGNEWMREDFINKFNLSEHESKIHYHVNDKEFLNHLNIS